MENNISLLKFEKNYFRLFSTDLIKPAGKKSNR